MKKNNERLASGHSNTDELHSKKIKPKLSERYLFRVDSRPNDVPGCGIIPPKNERDKRLQSKEKAHENKK